MMRCLDNNNLREALKCASALTGELRTAKLSPQSYYELYMNVTNELRGLELFFEDEDHKSAAGTGRSVVELYENVQHAGNIIPRLYLLITVASVYIKSKKAPAKDILFDLVELCRGVQHPMRGLFLRNYLSQIARDKLPDVGSEYEGSGGTVQDSIEFILQNFGEMNKLWVRMQHQGAVRDRARREKERRNLRQLVGTNLVRLSELSGVDLTTYKETVLPRILEQTVNCRDVIAQEYLMECIIQVFPDEFHLATLDAYLTTCTQLHENVNVKDILITLMNRLSAFVTGGDSAEGGISATAAAVLRDTDMFALFHKHTSTIIDTNPKLSLAHTLALQVALLNFSTKLYPANIANVDEVLGFSAKVIQKQANTPVPRDAVKLITDLLTLPLDALSLAILDLAHYSTLLETLDFMQRKQVAVTIMTAVLRSRSPIDTVQKVDTLFQLLTPVLRDDPVNPESGREEGDMFEFDQEQNLVARLVHLISNEDTDVHYQLYLVARKYFGQGGAQRMEYTLPPLVFGALALSARIRAREEAKDATLRAKTKKAFGLIHDAIIDKDPPSSTTVAPAMALRLCLQAAQTADRLDLEPIAYEFFTQAFLKYELLGDSKDKYAAINLIIASLQTFVHLDEQNYGALVANAGAHVTNLLKKTDQCRAVLNCAHLYWLGDDKTPGARDVKRMHSLLQKSIAIARDCMGQQVHLFLEILNKYLYFFDRPDTEIPATRIRNLLTVIERQISTLDNSESSRLARTHYENTIAHIQRKKIQEESAARYQDLDAVETDDA